MVQTNTSNSYNDLIHYSGLKINSFTPTSFLGYPSEPIGPLSVNSRGMIIFSRWNHQIGAFYQNPATLFATNNKIRKIFNGTVDTFLDGQTGQYDVIKGLMMIDVLRYSSDKYDPEKGENMATFLVHLESESSLWLVNAHDFVDGDMITELQTGVVSFDYMSSSRIPDNYAYSIFSANDGELLCSAFETTLDEFLDQKNVEVNYSILTNKVKNLDYVSYVRISHNQTSGKASFIIDGDDQALYVFNTQVEFDYIDKKDQKQGYSKFRMVLNEDPDLSDEVYYKPINFHSIECDLTRDFLICATPDTYPESFEKDQSKYRTMLIVWARTTSKQYQGNGYTYRIETVGDIEPSGAFAIWNYWGNEVILLSQYSHPKIQRLTKKVSIVVNQSSQNSDQNQEKLVISDLDLALRSNRWSSKVVFGDWVTKYTRLPGDRFQNRS